MCAPGRLNGLKNTTKPLDSTYKCVLASHEYVCWIYDGEEALQGKEQEMQNGEAVFSNVTLHTYI